MSDNVLIRYALHYQILFLPPFPGTNRRRNQPVDTWLREAQIACPLCGSTNIFEHPELGWACDKHRKVLSLEAPCTPPK